MPELSLKRGDEIQLEVTGAAFEGKSVARKEGYVVFVEGAVPGDVVTARILKAKKNFAEAKVVHVEKPSPLRTEPRCKHVGVCGGCKWQHVEYQAQLQFKQQHVIDAFERIGGFSGFSVLPILGCEEIFFYRNKMEYSFSEQQWLVNPPGVNTDDKQIEIQHPQSEVFLGLHVPLRYDKVLDIEECHLQSQASNQILNFTRSFARRNNLPVYSSKDESGYFRFLVIRQSTRTHELMVNLVTYDDRQEVMRRFTDELVASVPGVTTVVNTMNTKKAQIAFGDVTKVYFGEGVIHEQLGKLRFTVSPSSFFQTNTAQAERLYGVAKSFAELQPTDVVFDLYSGTGSIALFVSDAVQEVIGIESVESAVRDAEKNAAFNNIQNCTFVLGDLKDRLTKDKAWMESHQKSDVMIIDPPRSGMHPAVMEEILELAPSRIVYVSCNPTTQARDVKILCAEKYTLIKLQPVDMFPHTYHIENVVLLHRK
ncbi:MAG: 23S rRNA (uracil(1939)-C(5))-methyltransferase RlmD [Ignavibacteriales bacterium]|nr:23S rRNA (uracil(1939)-C(5))-methyltransferase RlmD [Ignavibacteriales bacterium]